MALLADTASHMVVHTARPHALSTWNLTTCLIRQVPSSPRHGSDRYVDRVHPVAEVTLPAERQREPRGRASLRTRRARECDDAARPPHARAISATWRVESRPRGGLIGTCIRVNPICIAIDEKTGMVRLSLRPSGSYLRHVAGDTRRVTRGG